MPARQEAEISPDSLIVPGKMALILADVHVIEAALLIDRDNNKNPPDKQALYRDLFEKFGINSGRYEQSLAYYRRKPEVYLKIYDKALQILETRKKTASGSQ